MKRSQSKSHSASRHNLSRREFLTTAGKGLGIATLLGGVPQGWLGSVYASDAPETSGMRFGMIALTDCSPIVIAHERYYLGAGGINPDKDIALSPSRQRRWSPTRKSARWMAFASVNPGMPG